jgi:hypothetical protein
MVENFVYRFYIARVGSLEESQTLSTLLKELTQSFGSTLFQVIPEPRLDGSTNELSTSAGID